MEILSSQIVESVRSTFAFSVDKFPLSGPDGLRTPYYGLFRSDNQEIVGRPVTRAYVPHQSEDVLALVEAVSHAFDGVAEVKTYFRGGHFVAIQPSKETRREIASNKDAVWPRIIVRAGYDGRAFHASMGYWRDLCKNLAILRQVRGTTVKIRHSSHLRTHMDSLINTFSVLKESWASLGDAIEHLQNKEVRISEFLNEIYGVPDQPTGRSATLHKNRTEAILHRLMDERYRAGLPPMDTSGTCSAWEAFNAVQGYVQHDAERRGVNKTLGDYGRAVASWSDPAVVQAEELAFA